MIGEGEKMVQVADNGERSEPEKLGAAVDPGRTGLGGEALWRVTFERVRDERVQWPVGERVTGTQAFIDAFGPWARAQGQEFAWAVYLDAGRAAVAWAIVGLGSAEGVHADPRDVLRYGLALGARFLVLGHNHPSAREVQPSRADKMLTAGLSAAAELCGLSVLDHVVFGADGSAYSFVREKERALGVGRQVHKDVAALMRAGR